MNKRLVLAMLTASAATLLAGCGGGGGDSAPFFGTSPTATFPLQSGYRALLNAGSSDSFTISGTCGGTARLTNSAAVAGSFEGTPALVSVQTFTASLSGCTPASIDETSTVYSDANYLPLGYSDVAGEYAKTTSALSTIPASVKLGDTAVVAVQTIYSSSSKTTTTGTRTLSYVIEADSASNTALVNLISRTVNTINQPLVTQQNRYRITATGSLTLLSIDVQASTTSTTHLVLTRS